MLVQEQLINIYQQRGFTVTSNNFFTTGIDMVQSEYTGIWAGPNRMATGAGMSLSELSVFEMLAEVWKPESIFAIGCAFGWSTIALRLFFPEARLACLDAGVEGRDNMAGINLTQDILDEIGSGKVQYGFSPQDTAGAIREHLDGRVDLAFIDGHHTEEQQDLDFESLLPFLSDEHVVFFHDVKFAHLEGSLSRIGRRYQGRARILFRTTSGIGMVYTAGLAEPMSRVINVFDGRPPLG